MENLPFPDDRFDVALSSQALHHVRRVLRPGGRLILLDHGRPYRWHTKLLLFPFGWSIGEQQAENLRGRIRGMVTRVFGNCEEVDRFFG